MYEGLAGYIAVERTRNGRAKQKRGNNRCIGGRWVCSTRIHELLIRKQKKTYLTDRKNETVSKHEEAWDIRITLPEPDRTG